MNTIVKDIWIPQYLFGKKYDFRRPSLEVGQNYSVWKDIDDFKGCIKNPEPFTVTHILNTDTLVVKYLNKEYGNLAGELFQHNRYRYITSEKQTNKMLEIVAELNIK